MGIKSLVTVTAGRVNVNPRRVELVSYDNLATITSAGYLNKPALAVSPIYPTDIFDVIYNYVDATNSGTYIELLPTIVNGIITLSAEAASGLTLTSSHILVGNAGNVATDVALSGDATLANTGAMTIANDAITTAKILNDAVTTAKILNANVTLAKLAATIAPSHVIKFAGQVTTVGGAAAEAFTITGAVAATDRAFVQIVDNGTANVTALQAVVTTDTLTVTFSANPGADTIINYQLIRAAS
ncbi:MAG TPA: hypothetical protein VK590_04695 [Saprospiraceae bacterium]|nr:hypothetical protein [Saprospiraceae bacterium]